MASGIRDFKQMYVLIEVFGRGFRCAKIALAVSAAAGTALAIDSIREGLVEYVVVKSKQPFVMKNEPRKGGYMNKTKAIW